MMVWRVARAEQKGQRVTNCQKHLHAKFPTELQWNPTKLIGENKQDLWSWSGCADKKPQLGLAPSSPSKHGAHWSPRPGHRAMLTCAPSQGREKTAASLTHTSRYNLVGGRKSAGCHLTHIMRNVKSVQNWLRSTAHRQSCSKQSRNTRSSERDISWPTCWMSDGSFGYFPCFLQQLILNALSLLTHRMCKNRLTSKN